MTATTFALPAGEYLRQIDADAADRAMEILRNRGIPREHRVRVATAILTKHVVSRRRRRIASAALAEPQVTS